MGPREFLKGFKSAAQTEQGGSIGTTSYLIVKKIKKLTKIILKCISVKTNQSFLGLYLFSSIFSKCSSLKILRTLGILTTASAHLAKLGAFSENAAANVVGR